MKGRATLRRPGADLSRMPVGLDLSGVSIAEGVRAALACGVFLLLDLWLHAAPLVIAASAAMITCFCDVGGTLRQRLPMLLIFTGLGAVVWAAFGLLRGLGEGPVLAAAGPAVFLFSMARVWGLRAQTVGNILIVVLALAIDDPLNGAEAARFVACFVGGGLWACLLTLVIWRIQPDQPVSEAVARVFGALAELAADLRGLVARAASPGEWDAHARAHRRAVRAEIEAARGVIASAVGAKGMLSGRTQQAAVLVEVADQLFGELIILSEMLDGLDDPEVRLDAERLLRRVRPILRVLATPRRHGRDHLAASLDRAVDAQTSPVLASLSDLIVDRLRVLVRVAGGALDAGPPPVAVVTPTDGWWSRVWQPLRDELTTGSAIFRHAARATLLTVPAIVITLLWWTPYAHWLTITVALTMQPFFAATWQRALERIGGTVLGALLGGALAFLPATPVVLAVALVVLSVIGFSVRQVSYGAYIGCLTPLIVLLFDIVAPGHSPWLVAGMRTFYTLVGGIVAVGACLVLWPSWEPDRLRQELRGTLLAYARLAAAVLAEPTPARSSGVEDARRAAGLANSNLEASLSRALQEPGRRHRAELPKLIAADALLRRLGATLLAVPHDASVRDILAGPARLDWSRALESEFAGLLDGRSTADERAPEAPAGSTLARVRRGLTLLRADLVPAQAGGVNGSPALSRS